MDGNDAPVRKLRLEAVEAALREVSAATAAFEDSPEGKEVLRALQAAHAELSRIGSGDDVREIVSAERSLMEHEREHSVTSRAQADFLDRGIKEMDVALNLIDVVRSDPERYRKMTAAAFSQPRNRIQGLPKDDVRHVLKGHRKDLGGILEALPFGMGSFRRARSRLLEVRRANLRQADQLYADLQRQALGL